MEKATLGFHIHKIWQILKHFTRTFHWSINLFFLKSENLTTVDLGLKFSLRVITFKEKIDTVIHLNQIIIEPKTKIVNFFFKLISQYFQRSYNLHNLCTKCIIYIRKMQISNRKYLFKSGAEGARFGYSFVNGP